MAAYIEQYPNLWDSTISEIKEIDCANNGWSRYIIDVRGEFDGYEKIYVGRPFANFFGKPISVKDLIREKYMFRLVQKSEKSSLRLICRKNKSKICLKFVRPPKSLFLNDTLREVVCELLTEKYFSGIFESGIPDGTIINSIEMVPTIELLNEIEKRYKNANPAWAKDILNDKEIISHKSIKSNRINW